MEISDKAIQELFDSGETPTEVIRRLLLVNVELKDRIAKLEEASKVKV